MSGPRTDLAELCRHLDSLGAAQPTGEARTELESSLRSKWDGVVVAAAKSLGAWGDAKSIAAVRDVLAEKAKLSARWTTAGALTQAIARHMRSADLKWIVPLCLKESNPHYRRTLFLLLAFTPKDETLRELAKFDGAAGVNPADLRHAVQFVSMQSQNGVA
jgi:hypothetical protein